MEKKIMLINADHPEECRAVLLVDGQIEDLIVEHASHEKIKGNIYLANINRIEPAIEAAFVDFGGKRFGFMPFKDVRKESYIRTGERKARTRIQDVLVRGQKLLVQVAKEGRDTKGPSLTNEISLPGRFLVLMTGHEATAISRKIEDESERKKLKEIVKDFDLPENLGVIIRTAGVGRTKAELQKDLQTLLKIWETIQASIKDKETKAPFLVYREPSQVVRTVRDHFTADTSQILVDDQDAFKELNEFVKLVMPRMHRRVRLYQETKPLFSQYKVEEQIESIYDRRVELPAGGSIVVDIGEAMVSIDVNSGKTTSASQLEETAIRTNLEAASEIARQLRLRDLGGLIVIDFIDMFQKKNKSLVEKELKQACKIDKARINISRISKFGLLEMSRQRISPPVKEGVFEKCSRCEGTGHVKSQGSLALVVLRKIQENISEGGVKVLEVVISPEVIDYLLNNKMKFLMELQERHKIRIQFVSRPSIPLADFAYNILERKKEEEILQEKKAGEGAAVLKEEEKERDGAGRKGRRESKPGTRSQTQRSKSSQRKRYTRRKTDSRGRGPSRGRKKPSSRTQPAAAGNAEAAETVQPAAKPVVDAAETGRPVEHYPAPANDLPPKVVNEPRPNFEDTAQPILEEPQP